MQQLHVCGRMADEHRGSVQVDSSQVSNGTVGEHRYQRTDSEGNEDDQDGTSQASHSGGKKKKLRLAVRNVMGGLLFLLVLTCVTFSKLTVIELADNLRHLTLNESLRAEVSLRTDYANLQPNLTMAYIVLFISLTVP